MKSILIFFDKHKLSLGFFIIILSFVCIRLPYFLYIPLTHFEGDSLFYFNVLEAFNVKLNHPIYYPAPGYPIFLKMVELLHNKSWFFVLIQSLIQLTSILFFFYSYYKVFNKYVFLCMIMLVGYLTSNLNLYFDSSIFPDSILGALMIVSISLCILSFKYEKDVIFYAISVVVIVSIMIRATALVLIPFLLVLLILNFKRNNSKKWLVKQVSFISVLLFLFAVFNYLSPLYSTFSIMVDLPKVKNNNQILRSTDDTFLLKLAETTPKDCSMKSILIFNQSEDSELIFKALRSELNRGVTLCVDKYNNLTYVNSDYVVTNLDSLNFSTLADRKSFFKLKEIFKKEFKHKEVKYFAPHTLYNKCINSIFYFKYFYYTSEDLGYENEDFYTYSLSGRWFGYYYKNNWGSWADNTASFLVNNNVKNRVVKELKLNKLKTLDDMDIVFSNLKSSRIYRRFVGPFSKIQPILFRNFLYPIIFVSVSILSIIGLFLSKFRSSLFWIVLLSCSLLWMMNYIFTFHFMFFYLRYTYQTTFLYYFSVIFLPFIVESFFHYKKNGKFNY